MSDLTEFLLARIAEDEAVAQTRAVRRQCEVKRRVIEYENEHPTSRVGYDILGILALPYADHPDYREEWRA